MSEAKWTLEPLTTRAGRDKLALSHNGRRVCDISIYADEDEVLARNLLKAVNNHEALVEALETAVLVLSALSPEDESLYGPRALAMARAALKAVSND